MTPRTRKTTRVVHWIATLLFVVPLVWSGIQYLIEAPRMMETMRQLGYPVYFTKILGVAKLLGAAALLYQRWPRLKEWAYAGFTFDLLGAFLSHFSVGDPLLIALVPIGFLLVLAVSYVTWRRMPNTGPRTRPVDTSAHPAPPDAAISARETARGLA